MGLLDRIVRNMGNLCTAAPNRRTTVANVLEDDVNSGVDISKKYKLKSKIGSGSFGTIYLCKEISTGNEYACKLIPKKCFREGLTPQQVTQEVGIMRYLPKHPSVIGYKDAFEDKRNIYIIMEVCKGQDLFTWLKSIKNPLNERDIAEIFKAMVEAVKFCHDYGIIHRDLKPDNFMFRHKKGKTSEIKLIDFGLATTFRPDQEFHDCVGCMYYIAPEVVLMNYGPQADIWSLGVILYNLLTQESPFGWGQVTPSQILNSPIDFDDEPWPEISKYGKDLVKRMLVRDPKKRLIAKQVLAHRWFRYAPDEHDECEPATRRGKMYKK